MYREHAPALAATPVVVCTWEHASDRAETARVVPDACVDILWDGARLSLVGPDTRAVQHALSAGTQLLGVRLVPGSAGALLGVSASAVRDEQVELRELWGDAALRLTDALQAAPTREAQLAALEHAVVQRARQCERVDPLIRALVPLLQPSAVEGRKLSQLSAALGVSERQLRRRCEAAVGYGPKLLERVLRLQAFMRQIGRGEPLDFARLAQALGYADQAHLCHDVAELAGSTPGQLRRERAGGSGESG